MQKPPSISLSNPVVQWLSSLGLQGYSEAIVNRSGLRCLHRVAAALRGESELERVGIESSTEKRVFLRAVEKLQKELGKKSKGGTKRDNHCSECCDGDHIPNHQIPGQKELPDGINEGSYVVAPRGEFVFSSQLPLAEACPRDGHNQIARADVVRFDSFIQVDDCFHAVLEGNLLPRFAAQLQRQCDEFNRVVGDLDAQRHAALAELSSTVSGSWTALQLVQRPRRRVVVDVTIREIGGDSQEGSPAEGAEVKSSQQQAQLDSQTEEPPPQKKRRKEEPLIGPEGEVEDDPDDDDVQPPPPPAGALEALRAEFRQLGLKCKNDVDDDNNANGPVLEDSQATCASQRSVAESHVSVRSMASSVSTAFAGDAGRQEARLRQAIRRVDCRRVFQQLVSPWIQSLKPAVAEGGDAPAVPLNDDTQPPQQEQHSQPSPTLPPPTARNLTTEAKIVGALAIESNTALEKFVVAPSPMRTTYENLLMRETVHLDDILRVVRQAAPEVSKTAVANSLTKCGIPLVLSYGTTTGSGHGKHKKRRRAVPETHQ